jgi:class 3 adenylate cyclase/tetratricopeptide (TPR) repeat protein
MTQTGTPAAVSDRTPRDYTPKHLAEKILQSKSALEGERKQVTVLFADVKGSMELAEQVDPEEWHRILDRFFQILADGVHRFEGTVNQYTGDGIMALFGAPIAHEDHAQRACWAALHLQNELRDHANELRVERGLSFAVRIGLNSGEVVVGKIGDDLRMDYTAKGHTVGLAARMEQLAEPGTAYLTEHTAALVSGYFELEDLGPSRIKGSADPVRIFALRGVGALRSRLDLSRARGFSKFVGRADELAALEAALERAIAGDGRIIGVVGEAGVGKSRLCYEFTSRCRTRGIRVVEAHGVAHGKMIPFLPVLALMRGIFAIAEGDPAQIARNKIAGALLLLDRQLEDAVPLLFEFLGVPDPDHPVPRIEPEVRHRQLLGVVKRIIEARSRREPGVTLLEDLHWFDGGTDEFLAHVVESVAGTRTLLLLNFRPEYRAEWMQRSSYQQLPLLPLGSDEIAELLRDLLGADPSLEDLPERLRERTGGNPFFIEEVVLSLAEEGALEGERGAYRLARPIREVAVPVSVQAVLSARIDRLPEREKQILQTASVVGRSFAEPLLRGVASLPEAELAEALRALVAAELVSEQALYPEAEYAFKHALTQEVAYGSQLGERRRRVHATVARALEEHYTDALDEKAALLAHHWEEAGEALEAARWHQRCAQWIGMNDPAQSVHHARRIRELLTDAPDSPEILELRVGALGVVALHGTRLGLEEGELDGILEEGNALLSRSGDPRALLGFLVRISWAFGLQGRVRDAVEISEMAISRIDQSDDAELRGVARFALAMTLAYAGSVDRSLAVFDDGVGAFGGLGAAEGYPLSPLFLSARGWALACTGRLDEAGRALDRAIALAAERGDIAARGVAHGLFTELERWRGAPQSALAHARQAVEVAEQVASPTGLRQGYYQLGHAYYGNGQLEEARAALEHGLATGRGHYFAAGLLSSLAATCAGLGDHGRARETATEAIAVARATGQLEIPAQIALAHVLRSADGLAAEREIEAALERALELIEETGSRVFVPQVHKERAELARLRGDDATREQELREVHRLYTEMGATGHAERLARESGL